MKDPSFQVNVLKTNVKEVLQAKYFLPKHSFAENCPLTNINMRHNHIVTTDTWMRENHLTVVADRGGAPCSLVPSGSGPPNDHRINLREGHDTEE